VQKELIDIYRNRVQSSVVYVQRLTGYLGELDNFLRIISPRILISKSLYKNYKKTSNPSEFKLANHEHNNELKLFLTTQEGMITVSTNGMQIRVRSFNNGELTNGIARE
jgi:beta-lactamase superfamily II metal-dependent hydrolase